ncbi:GAP family protein [Streptomyces sp. NBC_00631]|uniref:GAP family protein n=1 Tax=Streptomyces sp. NBC_00631 TaxID=2975793 RepID=UPI00386E7758
MPTLVVSETPGVCMVLDLMLIALAITLDPLPLMAFVLVLASDRGIWKGLVFILSWLACLTVVIAAVLVATGGRPPPPKSAPSTAALAAKLFIGVALVLYGERRRRRLGGLRGRGAAGPDRPAAPSSPAPETDQATVWGAAGLAVLLQPWGLVAAGATTVVEADTSRFTTWLALFGFCSLATASLLVLELYGVFAPAAARARLLRLRAWLVRHQDQALVTLCLLLGFWLMGKSLYQLTGCPGAVAAPGRRSAVVRYGC